MKKIIGLIAASATALTLLATASPAGANTATATVNVVHGIPGASVNVCVDGTSVMDNFNFGGTIVGAKLAAGSHDVKLVAAGSACTAGAILSGTYDLTASMNYTIVANLNAGGSPNLKVFVNNVSKTPMDKARLTIRHTAEAPAVNVWANNHVLIGGTTFVWGKSKAFVVPAGSYKAKVTLPGSKTAVIGPATLKLAAGKAYQVYAIGNGGSYSLAVIATWVGTK
jgi:hypothetical protein